MSIFAARLTNQPVLVSPEATDWMRACIGSLDKEHTRIQELYVEKPVAYVQDDFWPSSDSWLTYYRPYRVENGTLFVPVQGALIQSWGYTTEWATGYTYIAKAFERGMADPQVARIAMVIDSCGGEVAGNFDLVDNLYAMRGQKPVWALVNERAYSAAYSLASVADKIIVARTGGVGSIGVVTSHTDMSGALQQRGVNVTFIYAGEHKVDGNATQPLPDSVKARIQSRMDALYKIFCSTVARNRGMSEQAVRDTQALTYGADEALSVKLADEVRPFDEAVAVFCGDITESDDGEDGNDDTPDPINEEDDSMNFTQDDLDKARAEGAESGRKEGATAERTRIGAILGSNEACGRMDTAVVLATQNDMSPEAARAVLATIPVNAAPAATAPEQPAAEANGNMFQEAMKNGNPNIPAGDAAANQQDDGFAAMSAMFFGKGAK